MKSSRSGFTIVELLIVIVVIAILAAITVVAYNGIQNRANDVSIKSDLSTISKKLESFKITSSNDLYPSAISSTGVDVTVSKGAYGNHYTTSTNEYNLLYCRMANGQAYAVVAGSKSGRTFAVTNAKSVYESAQQLTTAGTQCTAEGMTGAAGWWGYTNGVWASGL